MFPTGETEKVEWDSSRMGGSMMVLVARPWVLGRFVAWCLQGSPIGQGVFTPHVQPIKGIGNIITISASTANLCWWQLFMSCWNGVVLVPSQRPEVVVASNASGLWGCGAYSGVRWFQLEWLRGMSEPALLWRSWSWSYLRSSNGALYIEELVFATIQTIRQSWRWSTQDKHRILFCSI